MINLETLYIFKNNEKVVGNYLSDYLLYQVYSPEVIRQAHTHWSEFSWAMRQNVPDEIQDLIVRNIFFSDKELQQKINEFEIKQAVRILKQYQSCDVPITQNPHVAQNRYNLLSKKGEKILKVLEQAEKQKHFSNQMADLAVASAHKFLGKDRYFYRPKITKKVAEKFALPATKYSDKEYGYMFPAIQLTRGCLNNCSHCDSRAKPVLSHMPWPLFRTLYRQFNKYYRHYPQKELDLYFSAFFADSDMLDYEEPISMVDSGDVGLFITNEKGACQYLTKGVKNQQNKLALAKALYSGQAVTISFVDTPKENMSHNLQQLNETLDTIESLSDNNTKPWIYHLHLKSGPSVSSDAFRGYSFEQSVIYNLGKAKDFPKEEVRQLSDSDFLSKVVFCPDGQVDWQEIQNNEVKRVPAACHCLYRQLGPQIPKWRLFMRRHFQKTK